MKHSSDGKVADSSARETGGKLSNKGSSFYKTDATGSNGIRAGLSAGRRAGPTCGGVPPPSLPRAAAVLYPAALVSMGKGRTGTGSRQTAAPQALPRGSDGRLSFPFLPLPLVIHLVVGPIPGPRTYDPSRADTPTHPGPTHGQPVCRLLLAPSSCGTSVMRLVNEGPSPLQHREMCSRVRAVVSVKAEFQSPPAQGLLGGPPRSG